MTKVKWVFDNFFSGLFFFWCASFALYDFATGQVIFGILMTILAIVNGWLFRGEIIRYNRKRNNVSSY